MKPAEEDPSQAKVLLVWRDEGEDENGVGNVLPSSFARGLAFPTFVGLSDSW